MVGCGTLGHSDKAQPSGDRVVNGRLRDFNSWRLTSNAYTALRVTCGERLVATALVGRGDF